MQRSQKSTNTQQQIQQQVPVRQCTSQLVPTVAYKMPTLNKKSAELVDTATAHLATKMLQYRLKDEHFDT